MGGCVKNSRRLVEIRNFDRDVFNGFLIIGSFRFFCIVIEVSYFVLGKNFFKNMYLVRYFFCFREVLLRFFGVLIFLFD